MRDRDPHNVSSGARWARAQAHRLQLWRDLQSEQQMFDEWPQGEHR